MVVDSVKLRSLVLEMKMRMRRNSLVGGKEKDRFAEVEINVKHCCSLPKNTTCNKVV